MSSGGALFDLNKLNDISKDVLVKIPASELTKFMTEWAREFAPEKLSLFEGNEEYIEKILDLGRDGSKPRKDLVYAKQIFDFISYFFDDYFKIEDTIPENVSDEDAVQILTKYLETYDHSDDQSQWFDKVREIGTEMGYAAKPKDFKKNPAWNSLTAVQQGKVYVLPERLFLINPGLRYPEAVKYMAQQVYPEVFKDGK